MLHSTHSMLCGVVRGAILELYAWLGHLEVLMPGSKETMCLKVGEVGEGNIICQRFLALLESYTPPVTPDSRPLNLPKCHPEQEAGMMPQ